MNSFVKVIAFIVFLCGIALAIPAPSMDQSFKLLELQQSLKQLGASLADLSGSGGAGPNLLTSFNDDTDGFGDLLK